MLYHWRQSRASHSATRAQACQEAARRALAEALGPAASVEPDPDLPQWPRVRFARPPVRVAVIAGAHGSLAADADVFVFLSPSLRAVSPDWLDTLVGHAMRPGIGAAGARLDGPDGRLLHAGCVLDPDCIVRAPDLVADDRDPGYRGQYRLARTVSAVSADCLAVRRDAFLGVGGFTADAGDFAAVDLCLKLAEDGLRNVWAPQARLRYDVAPAPAVKGADWMRARWAHELAADRYFNPCIRKLSEKAGWNEAIPPRPPSYF
jgi:GT2 family glycosyltransferase